MFYFLNSFEKRHKKILKLVSFYAQKQEFSLVQREIVGSILQNEQQSDKSFTTCKLLWQHFDKKIPFW